MGGTPGSGVRYWCCVILGGKRDKRAGHASCRSFRRCAVKPRGDMGLAHRLRQSHRLVEMPEISVVAVEDFQRRFDGAARFMSWPTRRARPRPGIRPTSRSTSVLAAPVDQPGSGQPLRRHFLRHGTNPQAGVRACSPRWEVEAQNTLTGLLLPLVHPLLARSMQQDLPCPRP